MSTLRDDVESCFEKLPEMTGNPGVSAGGVQAVSIGDVSELTPGFLAMREYNTTRLKVMLRRGYRHFAGTSLPEDSTETFNLVKPMLGPLITTVVIEAFCDGVQIGQATSHWVKMALFYDSLTDLFTEEEFRNDTLVLALRFADDSEVAEFFTEHTVGSAEALSHITGFRTATGVSRKIWDLWLLCGTSMVTASYMAGHQLGVLWKEREVLTEMEQEMEVTDDDSA